MDLILFPSLDLWPLPCDLATAPLTRVSSSSLKFRLGYMTCFGQYSESWVSIPARSLILRGSRIAPLCSQASAFSRKGMTVLVNWPQEEDEYSLPLLKEPQPNPALRNASSPPTNAWAIQLIFRRVNDRRFLHAAEVLGLLYIFTVTKLNPCTWLSPMQQGREWVGISSIFFVVFFSNISHFPI